MYATSGVAHCGFVISIKEIPEWAPGYPLEIRHIIIDDSGKGLVIVTNVNTGVPEVSQVARFRYDPDDFAHWADDYRKYKSFYGKNEDSDGRLVEGNPKTVILSFFKEGLAMKSISLSGTLAYSSEPGGSFGLPATVIALRDKLLAYAEQAEPQTKAKYYMTATAYGENEKYWLLKSAELESIPVITDITDEKDLAFLNELVNNSPVFLPLEEEHLNRLKKNMKLSEDQFKGTFRTSKESDAIIEIKFMRSTPYKDK